MLSWVLKFFSWSASSLMGMVLLLTCGLTLASGWNDASWMLDLLSHFRMVYFLVLSAGLLLLVVLAVLKKRRRIGYFVAISLLGVCWGINAVEVLPYYQKQNEHADNLSSFSVLTANVFGYVNKDESKLVRLIREQKPDIICLNEYTEDFQQKLLRSGALKPYPYQIHGQAHIALYSKLPVISSKITYPFQGAYITNDASLVARIKSGKQQFTLVTSHPPLPMPQFYQRQARHFQYWADHRREYGEHWLVTGDLNATPWSRHFRNLLAQTGLRDSQKGFGIQLSWPTYTGLPLLPIDHVLISPGFVVLNRQLGPFIGSDHLPVYVELGLR